MAGKFNTVMVNKDGLVKYPSSGNLTIPADLNLDLGNRLLTDSKYNTITSNVETYFNESIYLSKNIYITGNLNASALTGYTHDIGDLSIDSTRIAIGGSCSILYNNKDFPGITFEPSGNVYFGYGHNHYYDGINDKFVFDVAEIDDPTLCGRQISTITTSGISNREDSLVTEAAVKSYVDSKTQPSLDDGWITGFYFYDSPSYETTSFSTITSGKFTTSFKLKHPIFSDSTDERFSITLYDTYGRKTTGSGTSRVYSMCGISIVYSFDVVLNYDGSNYSGYYKHTFVVKIGDSKVTNATASNISNCYQQTVLTYNISTDSNVPAEELEFKLEVGNSVVNGKIPVSLTINGSSDNITITQSNDSYVMTDKTWGSSKSPVFSIDASLTQTGIFIKDLAIGSMKFVNYTIESSYSNYGYTYPMVIWYDKNNYDRYITIKYTSSPNLGPIHGTNDSILNPYLHLPYLTEEDASKSFSTSELIITSSSGYSNVTTKFTQDSTNGYGGILSGIYQLDFAEGQYSDYTSISNINTINGTNNAFTLRRNSSTGYGELQLIGSSPILQVGDEYYTKLRVDENEAKFGVPFKAPVYEITSNGSYNKLDEEVSFRVVKQNGNYTIVIDPPSA